ncbi:MAG: glycosyltransferase [Puniceicoccales bacterium]|jgi:glycosyltransferase involved in cell wall biosynthesis|nr:glycosyltransferase [Puniceicoccales bacterium]
MNLPKKARRILVIQDYLRSGGTERQSLLLAGEFAAAGREVLLLRFRPGGALADHVPPGVGTRVLQPFDTRLDWFAPGLGRAVRRFLPDCVLCMGRMANGLSLRAKAAVPSASVVCTMRTGKPLSCLHRLNFSMADAVVANSAAAAVALECEYGVRPGRIHVIRNAPVFAPEEDGPDGLGRAAVEPCVSGGGCVLLCVAMFRPEKNHRGLLRSLAALPVGLRWRLVLVGDGPERGGCEEFARNTPSLAGRVEFAGFQADPRPFYRSADVAVLASLRESLPNFLVEAHLHGVPSVAYSAGGAAECGGLMVPLGGEADLATLLSRLLGDAAFRAAESARVRAFAEERFSRAAQSRAYLRLLDELAA